MSHTYAKKGNRLYRYYMCVTKMKRGADACPTPSLPAQEIEDFVVEQIRKLARDPELQRQVSEEASKQQRKLIPKLEKERKRLQRELQAKREEIKRLATAIGAADTAVPALAERIERLESFVVRIEGRVDEIDSELTAMRTGASAQESIAMALNEFDGVWEVLAYPERAQLVSSLIEAVRADTCGHVEVRFSRGRSSATR